MCKYRRTAASSGSAVRHEACHCPTTQQTCNSSLWRAALPPIIASKCQLLNSIQALQAASTSKAAPAWHIQRTLKRPVSAKADLTRQAGAFCIASSFATSYQLPATSNDRLLACTASGRVGHFPQPHPELASCLSFWPQISCSRPALSILSRCQLDSAQCRMEARTSICDF